MAAARRTPGWSFVLLGQALADVSAVAGLPNVHLLGRTSLGPSTSHVWFTKPVFLPSTVELVVDREPARTVAALRSAKSPETTHLVLTLEA